jgi:hypothetical protein
MDDPQLDALLQSLCARDLNLAYSSCQRAGDHDLVEKIAEVLQRRQTPLPRVKGHQRGEHWGSRQA